MNEYEKVTRRRTQAPRNSHATRHDRQDGGMLVRQEINLNAERRRPEALTGGRGRRKIFRERGWWQSGLDKLASYRPLNKLEGWVSIGQTLDAKLLSALTVALQSTAPNHPPFLEDSTLARLFRNGTEMG